MYLQGAGMRGALLLVCSRDNPHDKRNVPIKAVSYTHLDVYKRQDRLSGHRLRIFYRVPAFLPVSLRFSDVSGHNPVVVLLSLIHISISF